MTVDHYRALFQYNAWASGRILESVLELGEAGCREPAGLDRDSGSILATLVHALDTEESWCARCQGSGLDRYLTEDQIASFEALITRFEDAASRWQDLLARLTDADLDSLVTNVSPRSGRSFTNPLWAMLSHALNHSTQHRSEVALALTRFGRSPGDLDFLMYFGSLRSSPA